MHFLSDGPEKAPHRFLFAHGAGGAMDTPWMNTVARGIAEKGIRVIRFEFPYMASRREGKRSGAPDRQPVLLDTWREAVEAHGPAERMMIGGKSLGGRMASMVADELGVRGLICFGYPFHPPGRPEKLRTAHLATLRTPTLILQGTRDPFGGPEEVAGYELAKSIRIEWIGDGDHGFKPRVKSACAEGDNLRRAVDLAADFILWSGR